MRGGILRDDQEVAIQVNRPEGGEETTPVDTWGKHLSGQGWSGPGGQEGQCGWTERVKGWAGNEDWGVKAIGYFWTYKWHYLTWMLTESFDCYFMNRLKLENQIGGYFEYRGENNGDSDQVPLTVFSFQITTFAVFLLVWGRSVERLCAQRERSTELPIILVI